MVLGICPQRIEIKAALKREREAEYRCPDNDNSNPDPRCDVEGRIYAFAAKDFAIKQEHTDLDKTESNYLD